MAWEEGPESKLEHKGKTGARWVGSEEPSSGTAALQGLGWQGSKLARHVGYKRKGRGMQRTQRQVLGPASSPASCCHSSGASQPSPPAGRGSSAPICRDITCSPALLGEGGWAKRVNGVVGCLPGKHGQSETTLQCELCCHCHSNGQRPSTWTPTTLEVSRGPHILEVVHVNDIDDGRHNPSPVLSRDKGRTDNC